MEVISIFFIIIFLVSIIGNIYTGEHNILAYFVSIIGIVLIFYFPIDTNENTKEETNEKTKEEIYKKENKTDFDTLKIIY